MRARRRATGLTALAMFVGALFTGLVVVSPNTYHDVGLRALSSNVAATSSAPSYSIDTYHDV
jgi:hypothetical protein